MAKWQKGMTQIQIEKQPKHEEKYEFLTDKEKSYWLLHPYITT